MKHRSVYRCAVYTRKSHEEGLDQDFNSLDAQYEACKSYIASQAGLGWTLRDERYDDGGISGGHMDRPGLLQLITDTKAGLIDVIVVYKVDRLTRSLTDFAKLVDVFDAHDVSFVSVTQAFNTTTSMGRLTLNVLLSFAQFEREVTAERIRDKFAASKKKGIWMGGTCPFGYRHEDRKLYAQNQEAKIVRALFELYVTHQNVRLVKTQADRRGFITRKRMSLKGKTIGAGPFSRGHIYRILSNPIYIGKIVHKDAVYDGQHKGIVPKALWDEVQSIKDKQAVQRKTVGNSQSNALLAGLLFDSEGQALVTHHASKKGKRYSYYVSQSLKTGERDSGWRLPATMIESLVLDTLSTIFASHSDIIALIGNEELPADQLQRLIAAGKLISAQIAQDDHLMVKARLNDMIEQITIQTDLLTLRFNASYICQAFGIVIIETDQIVLCKPMTIRRRGQELKMLISGEAFRASKPDQTLIKLLAEAYRLRIELEAGQVSSIKAYAQKYALDHGDAKNLVPLGYIAPSIVEDILSGHQPIHMTARGLKSTSTLPIIWIDQRRRLGFN